MILKMIALIVLLVSGFEWSAVRADNLNQPRVETPHGVYLGSHHKTDRKDRNYHSFVGIPYAKPPIGERRFKAPEPLDSYLPVFNATTAPSECLQWDFLLGRGMIGSEDCLYLNIYTNWIPGPPDYLNTQPILVFLHAGTWLSGSGASDIFTPDYLIEADIMVITLNHRLGPFGFLATENTAAPGNYGLLDQIQALEWIRTNARYFGGMNDSVTVMGSGAGGISAHFLTLTPKARGSTYDADEFVLLHRAISQSGTAYSPNAFVRDSNLYAVQLAMKAGCHVDSPESIVKCLREVAGEKIIEALPSLFVWDEEPNPFGPVLDSKWMGSDAFFPDEPHHLIRHKQLLQVPWIVGTNKNDGAFRVQDILKDVSLVKQLNQKWDKFGPILLHLTKYSCKDPVDMAKTIRKYYMGDSKFGQETEQKFIEMMTDRFFLYPTDKASKEHCDKLRGDRTFCYRYEHHFCGKKTFLDILHSINPQEAAAAAFGASLSNPRFQNTRDVHGYGMSFLDELMYLFPSSKIDFRYGNNHDTDDATKVSTIMLISWSNFVKGGDPTPVIPGFEDELSPWGTWWEPYVRGTYFYMQIDPTMETQETPLKAKEMEFWDNLPLFENRDHNVLRDEL